MTGQIERDKGYAWVVLVAASFINFLNGSVSASYGVFLAEYVEYFHIRKANASIVSALGVGFGYCVGFLVGFFVSHLGVRKATFISAILLSGGCAASYVAPNIYVLYFTHGLFPGIGITAYLIVGQASIGDYFKKYVGLAQAILTSGSCVGYTICPPVLALLVEHYGWRGAMLLLAGLNLHGFIMAILFPSSKRKPPKSPAKQPSQDISTTSEKPSIFEDFIIVKDLKFVIYLACMGVGSVGQTTMYVFMVARAQSIGISKENSALLFTIYGIVSIFSRPLFGAIADKIPNHRMALMSVCIIICGLVSAAVNWMDTYIWMTAYVSLFGFLSAGYMALIATVLGDILPPKRLTLAIGLLWSVVGLASIGSTACSGYLVDVTGSYGTPFLVFGLVSASAGFGGFALHWIITQERKKGKEDAIIAEVKADTEMLEIKQSDHTIA